MEKPNSNLLWSKPRRVLGCAVLQPRRLEDEMFSDLRFGLRMLLKNKSFTRWLSFHSRSDRR